MENITFQYPTSLFLLCLALALVYALIVYFRDKKQGDWKGWTKWALGSLRFLGVTLLASLLLSPLLKRFTSETKQPIVVIAQDGSQSVSVALKDQKETYTEMVQALETEFAEDFEVKTYTFGSSLRPGVDTSFQDKVTNISGLLKEVYDRFSNQNLGAVILASDGIFNEGANPIYSGTKLEAPIYTIALGDTTPQKDLILKRVLHNNIAYLGDEFSVLVDLQARNFSGSRVNIELGKMVDGKFSQLERNEIRINKDDFFNTQEFILPANVAGVQRYRARVTGLSGEASFANNSKDFFVDVLDTRQQILILAGAPHPDISAIKSELEKNKNYEIEFELASNFTSNFKDYSFVIMHGINPDVYAGLFSSLNASGIPNLEIWGAEGKPSPNSLIPFNKKGGDANEITVFLSDNFTYYSISDELKNLFSKFPPLQSPFGEYKPAVSGQTLLNQKIGAVETDYPMLVLGEQNGTKKGVLAGEGLWRWRLFDYIQNQNHDLFREFTTKLVQYLSTKEDKRKFRISLPKNIFKENETVIIDAELYNNAYELVNIPEASILLRDGTGKEYNFTFSKTNKAYRLNAGVLPVGNYRFTARTNYSGESLSFNGQFSVQPIQLKLFNTTADHKILSMLSNDHG
ncbi:MAG: hypothetical protein HKN16_12485, partial [Saprospiraceae bacterium]|nr:hypothetical protein [Saprospiraceae bacterium]